jgi:hypothetical protein
MPEQDPGASFSHLVRAVIAIVLTLTLPFVLYGRTGPNTEVLQVYLDALAAVVAFYFGASSRAA